MSRQNHKKALVLGGTTDHIRLIEILKEKGFYVILMDYLDDPPAKKIADIFLQISILDKDMVLQYAKLHGITNVFVTSIDQALLTAAYVSQQLNLPFHIDFEAAFMLTNKTLMKKLMFENGIPTSNYKIFKSLEEINEEKLSFPAVMKPVDANSSKGVIKVNNKSEIIENFSESMKFSTVKEIIVEEFIEGKELSIDAFINDGNVTICMITENVKSTINADKFTITESVYNIELENNVSTQVKQIVELIFKAINIKNGPLLVQALYNENTDEIKVIEFSSRLGGGSKYFYINQIKNFDIIRQFVNITLGESIEIGNLTPTVNYAKFKYLYTEPCVIHKYVNFEELKSENIIKEYFIYKEIGTEIFEATKSTDRCSGIFLTANNINELSEKETKTSILEVQDKNGLNRLLSI